MMIITDYHCDNKYNRRSSAVNTTHYLDQGSGKKKLSLSDVCLAQTGEHLPLLDPNSPQFCEEIPVYFVAFVVQTRVFVWFGMASLPASSSPLFSLIVDSLQRKRVTALDTPAAFPLTRLPAIPKVLLAN